MGNSYFLLVSFLRLVFVFSFFPEIKKIKWAPAITAEAHEYQLIYELEFAKTLFAKFLASSAKRLYAFQSSCLVSR